MKKKQFMSKLAALTMAAAMGITALPATAVFAAEVVSVDASDAGAFSSATDVGDAYKDALNAKLASTSFSGLKSDLQGADIGTALTTDVTAVTVGTGADAKVYTMSNFEITGATAPSYKTTADGGHIVMPVLTIRADLDNTTDTNDTKPAGTVTFTAEATALTKSERVDAAAAVINAAGNDGTLDTTTYQNSDNSGSLDTAVRAILNSGKLDNNSVLQGLANITIKTTQGTVSKATKTAAGSEGVSVELSTKLLAATTSGDAVTQNDSKDPKWDKTAADQAKDQDYKATASYTATIKKLDVTSEDSDYQTKVANALAGVSFTNEDLKYTDSSDANKVKDLTTASKIESTNADAIKSGVWGKVAKALDSIGVKENNYSITLRHLTKASHKADGSVEILVDQKRTGDSKDVQYATVTVPISHSKDTVAIGDEVSAKIVDLVKKYVADSKDITPTVEGKAAQKKEITAKLQTAVENALSDKLDGTDTIASEIDKVEVEIPDDGFTASTASTNGSISKANVTVTFKNDAPAGTALKDPGKGFWAAAGTSKTQTVFEYDNAETHHDPGTAPGVITLYKVTAVSATSLTLPEETPYNTLSDNGEIKVTPSFTPAASNNYVIRWTLSDNSKFKFKASESAKTYADATATHVNKNTAVGDTTAFLANDGIALTFSGNPGDTATLTAELIDSDGLVAAKASTTLKAYKGFSDVQNTHDYAYNAIKDLSSKQTVSVDGKDADIAVIDGVGNNLFNPDGDVTRAQFVTFLYRLDQTIKNDSKTTDSVDTVTTSAGTQYLEDKKTTGTANSQATFTLDDGSTRTLYYDASVNTPETYTYKSYKTTKTQTKFTDVDANAYYAKAVDWAVANGITSGKTDTTFDPNGKVTRAEAVTFMYRYFAANQSYNAADFTDVANTAYYANAVGWASSNGVTQGKTAKTFAPNDTTTRKEAAAFIYRATNTAKINK